MKAKTRTNQPIEHLEDDVKEVVNKAIESGEINITDIIEEYFAPLDLSNIDRDVEYNITDDDEGMLLNKALSKLFIIFETNTLTRLLKNDGIALFGLSYDTNFDGGNLVSIEKVGLSGIMLKYYEI